MDEVLLELKEHHQTTIRDKETFKNKIRYYSVMDDLNNHQIKGRIKPSNIKNRRLYPKSYFILRFFGF